MVRVTVINHLDGFIANLFDGIPDVFAFFFGVARVIDDQAVFGFDDGDFLASVFPVVLADDGSANGKESSAASGSAVPRNPTRPILDVFICVFIVGFLYFVVSRPM
jgi:hypothetical protein